MQSQNLKIGMYVNSFLPLRGGTELATFYLARELSRSCNVRIYTFNWIPTSNRKQGYGLRLLSEMPETEIMDGVCVHRYPIANLPIVKDFSVKLVKDLGSSDVDIVHFQGAQRLLSRLLLQGATCNKVKVLTTHALHEAMAILRRSNNSLIRPVFVKSLRSMNHIIGLSKMDEKLLLYLGIPKNKITVIPNGIDPKKFEKRRHFVEKSDKMKILCVARFANNKNYESLIYALSRLKDRIDVEAYFIGDFDNREYFRGIVKLVKMERLEKTVKIGLSLDDAAVVDCYLSCDLFVLPSIMETFPLAILEAMYAGLPIVATRVGGIPEIIRDGVNGFLVPPKDSEQLYYKCLQLLRDKRMRDEMRRNNIETAKSYTWSKIASSTQALYQQLVREN